MTIKSIRIKIPMHNKVNIFKRAFLGIFVLFRLDLTKRSTTKIVTKVIRPTSKPLKDQNTKGYWKSINPPKKFDSFSFPLLKTNEIEVTFKEIIISVNRFNNETIREFIDKSNLNKCIAERAIV